MNTWFTYVNNGTHEIYINMEQIKHVVFDGKGGVFVDDLDIRGESAERFKIEFESYRLWKAKEIRY